MKSILQEVTAFLLANRALAAVSYACVLTRTQTVLPASPGRSNDLPVQCNTQGNPEEYTAGHSGRSESSISEQGAEQHDEVSSPATGDRCQNKHQQQGSDGAIAAEVVIGHLFVTLHCMLGIAPRTSSIYRHCVDCHLSLALCLRPPGAACNCRGP